MRDQCAACGRPLVALNVDKMRGVVGLTYGWFHQARWRDRLHRAVPLSMIEETDRG